MSNDDPFSFMFWPLVGLIFFVAYQLVSSEFDPNYFSLSPVKEAQAIWIINPYYTQP